MKFQITYIFIQEKALENVACEKASSLFHPQNELKDENIFDFIKMNALSVGITFSGARPSADTMMTEKLHMFQPSLTDTQWFDII